MERSVWQSVLDCVPAGLRQLWQLLSTALSKSIVFYKLLSTFSLGNLQSCISFQQVAGLLSTSATLCAQHYIASLLADSSRSGSILRMNNSSLNEMNAL